MTPDLAPGALLAAPGGGRHPDRAAELVRALRRDGAADRVGLPATPPTWPGDGTLVTWLRRLLHPGLHTRTFEEVLAWRWLGTDPYGLRLLPDPPPWLASVDVTALPAEHVGAFLRRLSLTREAPVAADLTPRALARDRRPVTVVRRSRERRRWGQPGGAPLLPEWTRVPHVVHGVWLGRELPETSSFWRNYAEGARRWRGRADFVVWTDIPRPYFARAARLLPPPTGRRDLLARAHALHAWAVSHDIALVNVHEVFSAAAPMALHGQFVLEMAAQRPGGYAAASDHLRVEVVHRFGGVYVDGDISLTPPTVPPPLPAGGPDTRPRDVVELIRHVAASEHGFTVNPFAGLYAANDIVAAPAGHPVLALWRECARMRYFTGQAELFGGLEQLASPPDRTRLGREVTPQRTGRVHHQALRLAGIRPDRLTQTRAAVTHDSELSWVPPPGGAVPGPPAGTDAQVLPVLARVLTYLRWQLVARDGNLNLSAVAPVIRELPDPDAAWTAVLTVLPTLGPGTPAVTSVTDARRNDDGSVDRVRLPPAAEALLDRTAPVRHWWGAPLGRPGRSVWLLDELVTAAVLRAAP